MTDLNQVMSGSWPVSARDQLDASHDPYRPKKTPAMEAPAKAPEHEFDGVLIYTESRSGMTKPTPVTATRKFVRAVRDGLAGCATDEERADWVINLAERYAAYYARPVITMDGDGPICSFCWAYWPLCGHQHLAGSMLGDAEDDGDV